MNLESLKKKATDLGIKGVMKRGKFTKQNKNELQEIIGKAEASGCRVLSSVKDLDIPYLENVTCENLIEIKDDIDEKGFHTATNLENKKVVSFDGGLVLVGVGFLTILGFSSWYFFPVKDLIKGHTTKMPAKMSAKTKDVKHYEQHI